MAKALERSSMRSASSSIPAEMRTRSSGSPRARRVSRGMEAWLMKQGSEMSELVAPKETVTLKSVVWSRMACENRDCTYEIEPLPLESLLDVFRNYGWLLTAACSNVFIMFSFEAVFESIAWRLNDWENHRLEQEYQDNLIFKHAVFQFVNNCKAQSQTLAH